MSKKDLRFDTIKKMLKHGEITSFKQLFNHVPISVMRSKIKTNHYRMKRIVENPAELQYDEVSILAGLIGVPQREISELIETFIKESKRNRQA